MIRTVTALYEAPAAAEDALNQVGGRMTLMKAGIVTAAPGEKPDFGTIYLSRGQREACEAELADGGSLLIMQVEGNEAAEQAVDLLDLHAQGALGGPEAPVPSPAPPPAAAAVEQPRVAAEPAGTVEGIPISTLSRRPPSEPEPEPEPAFQAEARPEPQPQPDRAPAPLAEKSLPLVEEELRIGKREVLRGGARVHSFIEEVPVTEAVELFEERTSIEHRPVNRRLSEEEIAASGLLQDRVIEVAEMREEAVVTKEAFVREELVVKKTIETRVEEIRETVRRTAIEMERLEPELADAGATGAPR
jgi:stress response protein YsnF